jgi:hypothetical protein
MDVSKRVKFAVTYEFIKKAGLIEPKDDFENRWMNARSGLYGFVALDNVCFICKPPVAIHRNHENRLHSTIGPAIEFEDGKGAHFVHGISFTTKEFNKAFVRTMKPKQILNIENVEQRISVLREYGYDYIIKETNGKIIDTHEGVSHITGKPVKYELYEFEMKIGRWELQRCRFVRVEDHTTHKTVTLGVPVLDMTETCIGAIAWTFDMTEKEYLSQIVMES